MHNSCVYCILFTNMQSIQEFFVSNFNNPILATLIVACLPIFELRGAIPFGMSIAFWGSKALNMGTAFLVGFIGSSLVVPFIALLFKPVLNYLKNTKLFKNLANKLEVKVKNKGSKIASKNTKFKKMLGVMAFVGIPLPLTGAYTGTMISVLIGLSFIETVISVVMGSLIAGVIITVFSSVSKNASTIILIVFIVVLILILLTSIIKYLINILKNKNGKLNV